MSRFVIGSFEEKTPDEIPMFWSQKKKDWVRLDDATVYMDHGCVETDENCFWLRLPDNPEVTRGRLILSKDPDINWSDNLIQFARLLAELHALGLGKGSWTALAGAMDLEVDQVEALFGRAQTVWDKLKAVITRRMAMREPKHKESRYA